MWLAGRRAQAAVRQPSLISSVLKLQWVGDEATAKRYRFRHYIGERPSYLAYVERFQQSNRFVADSHACLEAGDCIQSS